MYDTFDAFILATNGQTIGAGECWDYINLIWSHLGARYYTYPPSDPSSTNHGVKWGWLNEEARTANTINGIIQITHLADVKRGDIVITSGGEYGHAGFASIDYNGTNTLPCYSQNYNGQRYVALNQDDMSTFIGAFRYTAWTPTPPTPTVTRKTTKSKFPFVLYANKFRNNY